MSSGVDAGRYVLERVITPMDAFDVIDYEGHDVYVVDHLVGARTGFDVLSWVKAGGASIPIVFVAGPDDHGTGVTAVAAGASCYVVQDSVESGLLEHAIRSAVEQTRALLRLRNAGIAVESVTSTKARLLFRIAERLREPAAAVLEEARRSLDSELPAQALESFSSIEDKANTLLTLANDLNDLSLLEAGQLRFNSDTFSLRGLVSHVSRSVTPKARERGVEIAVDVATEVPDAVIGDPGRLRPVIISFIESVLARSDTDRIDVRIELEEKAAGSIMLRFDVEARAVGASLGDVPESSGTPMPFAGDSAAPLASGSFGMPVALETVSRMGGSVTVNESGDRIASVRFTIRLEVGDAEHGSRPSPGEHPVVEGPILVIADSVSAGRSIMSSLIGAELPCIVAPSVDAWTKGRPADEDDSAAPSLVIVDSTTDSFAVCDEFRKLVSATIPIVVVVASGKRGDAGRCREREVRGYLARPLDSGDLVDVVRSSISLTSDGDTTTLVTRHWLREGRSSLHILVVDDSSTNRFVMTRMLEHRGHSTAVACEGEEAVAMVKAETFDVILMDLVMPRMDGFEATRLIRESSAVSSMNPLIIAVSAFADQANMERSEVAGMDGFLPKPINPDDLFAVIEQRKTAVVN